MNRHLTASRKNRRLAGCMFESRHLEAAVGSDHVLRTTDQVAWANRRKPEYVCPNDVLAEPWNQTRHMTKLGVWVGWCLTNAVWRAPNRGLTAFGTGHSDCGDWDRRVRMIVKEKARLLPKRGADAFDGRPCPRDLSRKDLEAGISVDLGLRRQTFGPLQECGWIPEVVEQLGQHRRCPTAEQLIGIQSRLRMFGLQKAVLYGVMEQRSNGCKGPSHTKGRVNHDGCGRRRFRL